ncbi:MAG: hypothetical protein ACO24H_09920 [Polynucleobacter sp.]
MMTDRQIAQQLLDTITHSTRRNSVRILVEVLEELQKSLLAEPDLLFDWEIMQTSTWEDAISKIDAICQELKSL